MTERLYYHDSYLTEFNANALEATADGSAIYLDRTAFYPSSGGQPFDVGSIAGVPVIEVIDEGERIAHRLASPIALGSVRGSIDWERRFDHMQQHSGQHLLSAVFENLLQLRTVSFHLGQEASTIDLDGGTPSDSQVREVERRANEIVCENRAVHIGFQDASEASGLRKASEREGTLRIVAIDNLDRSACGGTHVRATGEIGPILIRKLEKVRQAARVEFLCGGRAVRQTRADYEALSKIAKLFSAALDDTPALVASQLETARAADKARRKLELELAAYHGRDLYDATSAGPDGLRRHTRRVAQASMEELRALAQNFTNQPKAVFVAAIEKPASVLYAVSGDVGIDAGRVVKDALAAAGGRGGGNPALAQGSLPDPALLDQVLAALP